MSGLGIMTIDDLIVRVKAFIRNRVPARVLSLIDVPSCSKAILTSVCDEEKVLLEMANEPIVA